MRSVAKNNCGRSFSTRGPSFKNTGVGSEARGKRVGTLPCLGNRARIDDGGLAAGQEQLAAVIVVEIPFLLDFRNWPLDGNLLHLTIEPNEFALVLLWIIDQCAPIDVAAGPAFDVDELDFRQAK